LHRGDGFPVERPGIDPRVADAPEKACDAFLQMPRAEQNRRVAAERIGSPGEAYAAYNSPLRYTVICRPW
jgi:hypothetical protein